MQKHKKSITIIAVLALFALLLTVFAPILAARADTVSSLEDKLANAQKAKEKAQNGLKNVQSEMKNAKEKRQTLDKQIAALENEIYALSEDISTNESQIAATKKELDAAIKAAEDYEDTFKERVRIMYERGSVSYLNIIFGAEGFADLLKRVELVSQITKHDRAVLQSMADAQKEIENKKKNLEETNQVLVLNREIQEAKKAEIDASKSALSAIIANLTSDENTYREMLDEADAAEEALRQEIRNMTASQSSSTPPTQDSGGAYCWPTPSTRNVTSPFGMRFHPIQKRNKMHTGIDIGAGYGASILAAAGGTVLRAGWNSGYGNYIVIDHGGGIQTLYGHCSVLQVSAGQSVSRGQQIALVGSTGNSTGPHLHFEVLKNGSYTDPMGYFG